ncbi:MAG TPA: GxxExxY protein [Chitinophagaceae bacterium]|nr:GxxExxY protein [Chitinophagaceae bacterium]
MDTGLGDLRARVKRQVPIDLMYKGTSLGKTYLIDMLVEEKVIIEIKSVDMLSPIHDAQLITYLKLADKRLGYLINFNVTLVKYGFKRIVYKF